MLTYSAMKNSANAMPGVVDVEAGDDLRFALRHVERRAVGLGDARDEIHQQQREQPGPVPAEAGRPAARWTMSPMLRLPAAISTPTMREAHGDLVGDDLRRRAHRAQERVLGIRRPAGEDDAVHAHRGEREDVQQARIDVGEGALRAQNGITAQIASAGTSDRNGARRNRNPLAFAGITISLNISLTTSANGWARPGIQNRLTRFGPLRACIQPMTLRSASV